MERQETSGQDYHDWTQTPLPKCPIGIQREVLPGSSTQSIDASVLLVSVPSISSNTRKTELIFTCKAVEAGTGCASRQPFSHHSPVNQEIGDAEVLHSETR